ncbi:hypothetical protein HYW75_03600 [Candidatus Pacearchaeota archaeon]|nr:hypothetical protein [Candidatus Pacearchaeota archaeon]
MKIEDHNKRLQESLKVIEESIEKGIVERQRTIGFSISAACSDMFEILLHKKDLISPGFMIKHERFNSQNKIKEKFPFDFPRKEETIKLISEIEKMRNPLCYGKPQKEDSIKKVIENFNKLKEIFKEEINE